jgi:RNA recognition motif-containing protein
MDDGQTVIYGSYTDMMKRSMDTVGGPEAKKARWSPTAFTANSPAGSVATNGANAAAANRDAFANYGYGPQANFNQQQTQQSSPIPGFANASPLYSTPSLSINTQTGVSMGGQASPNPASAVAFMQQQQQQQQQQQANAQNGQQSPLNGNAFGFGGAYNILGMGIPGMNMLGGFPYNNQMNFQQQGLPSLNLQIPQNMQGGSQYSPAALSAAMGASNNTTGRTVYVGNLPSDASVDELLNLVHFGPLESIRVLPEKSCVFLSFLDGATAAAFHADATIKKLSLHGQELKIGWGKPSPVPAQVALAISQSNASRNVYLGGLDEGVTEEQLRDDLSRFGLIDQVKIVRDKNIGFVHFLSISVATKVVNTLPTEPSWAGKRVNYGKDRCAYVPKSQQAAAQQAQAAAAQTLVAAQQGMQGMSPTMAGGVSPFSPYGAGGSFAAMGSQALNRTVYLGNIHPETTIEDLCNAIRGGVLQSIRYMADKHIAFVTFVDSAAAFTFFQVSSYQPLTLNNRRLKVGWGKNSGPLPPTLALAVHGGATRNVYIGNIAVPGVDNGNGSANDWDFWNDEKLRRDFGEYGEVELVNFLKEKNCAFVNFTNISNAIKAIEGIKQRPEYSNLRIAHGKDRCANPPRSGPQGSSGMRRSASGSGGPNNNNNHNGGMNGSPNGVESDAVFLGGEGDEGADEFVVPTSGVTVGIVDEDVKIEN